MPSSGCRTCGGTGWVVDPTKHPTWTKIEDLLVPCRCGAALDPTHFAELSPETRSRARRARLECFCFTWVALLLLGLVLAGVVSALC